MFITREDVKSYMQLAAADKSKDDAINLLIPSIIAELANDCGIPDEAIYIRSDELTFSEKEISLPVGSEDDFQESGFIQNSLIEIFGSRVNDGYYVVDDVGALELTCKFSGAEKFIDESPLTNDPITIQLQRIYIPTALKKTALAMVAYSLNRKIQDGIKSESIGDVSKSFEMSYPKQITDQINNFRRVKW